MGHSSTRLPKSSLSSFIYKVADTKPEVVQVSCITAGLLCQPVPSPFNLNNPLYNPVFDMPTPVAAGIAVGWNYSDAIDSFIMAHKLLKEDTYHTTRNKVKAALNIVSGVQLLVFSDNFGLTPLSKIALTGATVLASPAFAFSTLCDLINVSIDLYYAAKETEFEKWLEERLLEWQHLNNKSKSNDEINTNKRELEELIALRCRVHAETQTQDSIRAMFVKHSYSDKAKQECFNPPTPQDRIDNANIQKQLQKNLAETQEQCAIKLINFIGMSLLAVASFVTCPPLVIAGTALVIVVSIYYLQKNLRPLLPSLFSAVSPSAALPFEKRDLSDPYAFLAP